MSEIKTGNLLKKILIFILGLFVMAMGVALSVKADLGVSPISCVPYVYSLSFPLTLGELTIILNALFIVIQIVLLRKKYRWLQLIQLPAVIVFGYCIDFALYLISGINTSSYTGQAFLSLLGCIVLAFGIFLEVKSDLTYLPGEGIVMAITDTFKKEFGKVKIGLDTSLVIFGILSSFVLVHQLNGIREGTVAAAFLIGFLVKFYKGKLSVIDVWLGTKSLADKGVE